MTAGDILEFIRENPEVLFVALSREHRTHQQSTIRSIFKILKLYSKVDTDLRNEASVEWAKKITAEDPALPFL